MQTVVRPEADAIDLLHDLRYDGVFERRMQPTGKRDVCE
jgi:hypothetical protein